MCYNVFCGVMEFYITHRKAAACVSGRSHNSGERFGAALYRRIIWKRI